MRNINDLTTWETYEKKLMKRKDFKKLAEKNKIYCEKIDFTEYCKTKM